MNLQLFQILYIAGFFIWIVPIFRQYKTNLFAFFLILGLIDPIAFISLTVFKFLIPNGFHMIFSYFLLVSLLDKNVIKKYFLVFLIPLAILLVAGLTTDLLDEQTWIFLMIFVHFLIFSVILKLYALNQTSTGFISIFYLVLLFYELTLIFKFIVVTLGFENATGYYIITTIVQIAMGLFFSIVREDNTKLVIKL